MQNTKKMISRRSFIAGLAGVAVFAPALAPGEAFATSWGPTTRINIGGVTYQVTSGVDEGITAKAYVTARATTNVKARSYAVRATLRNAIGGVVASSGLVYNKSSNVSASCKHKRPKGFYRAVGVVVAGGVSKDAKPTPTCYSVNPPLPVNENGQTYGALPDSVSDEAPELISVVGIAGESGYVYFGAFDNAEEGATIPVFALDGQTVIDQFHFGND